ncbi:alpha/beta hydrolase, partial [Bradyrhizobium sp. Cham227]|nr:alpha/beta hydrolase [Bradyrhizobium brasilense]
MKPVVFADTIGWLNVAKGRRGVVIAGAHGHEDLCSRRFLKLLSDRAAAAGLPVLLFDYPGCGDA